MTIRENYEQWLKDFADDSETISELEAIRNDEKELEDRFYTELSFGTAGMRGVLGAGMNRMNKYNVRRATKGLAGYLLEKPEEAKRGVVIAYDSRRCSAEFAKETALVLCAEGVPAFLFDALRPVPILSYAVRHLHAIAGVVITASHNPPQYNGYKVYGEDGAQVAPEVAKGITRVIRGTKYTDCKLMDEQEALDKGLLKIIGNKEVDDDYIAQVKTLSINPELLRAEGSKLNIVYTPLHGSGNVPVRRLLKEIGLTNVAVVKEQEMPDPNFSTIKVPNPEDPGAYELAFKLAAQVNANVIFATDPDCDRLGVAVKDGQGEWHLLTGNQIGCVLLHYILSSKKKAGTLPKDGAAVKSIVSTSLANRICEGFGIDIFETLTGFKFIGEKIQQFMDKGDHTFLFGFEESYGFLSSTFVRDKDGVNASLLVSEVACACMAEGITFYDRIQEIYKEFGYYADHVVSTTLPGKDGLTRMKEIMANLRTQPPKEIAGLKVTAVRDYLKGVRTTADGKEEPTGLPSSNVLYFELEGGHWVCVRPSGTEPKIKLYVNSNAAGREEAEALNTKLCEASKALMA